MKAVLAVFMVSYLHLMDGTAGTPMHENEATEKVHLFNAAVYLTPFLGRAAQRHFPREYRTIILLLFARLTAPAMPRSRSWAWQGVRRHGCSPAWV